MELSIRMKLFHIISLLSLKFCIATDKNESVVIIALPQSDGESVTSWERGAEILPGAYVAVESINNNYSAQADTNLNLIMADSGLVISEDESYSRNLLELAARLKWNDTNVIGIAGLLHPNTLLALQAFQLPIASLIGFSNSPQSNVLYLTASTSVLTDSVVAFVNVINQTRIGVISESTHSYYSTISNDLLTKANVSLYIHIGKSHHKSFSDIIDEVINFNIHVMFLSVRPSTALSVLHEACKRGMKWPDYAWILHSHRLEDLRDLVVASEECNQSNIFEGVLLFQLTEEHRELDSDAISRQTTNPFAFLLRDAIWALALATDNNRTTSFMDTISDPSQSSDVYIYQASLISAELVGVYSGNSSSLTTINISSFAYNDPIIQLVAPSPYLLIASVICLLFNTLMLILYLCFRKHPDVKATNVSLSLLIFIGCYLLIGFAIGQFFRYNHAVDLCIENHWMSATGLGHWLVYATVLVKMLRVYHIFTLHRRIKPSVYTVYIAPVFYTLLVLMPTITLNALWTFINPIYLVKTYYHVEPAGYIIVDVACFTGNFEIWMSVIQIHHVCLILIVSAVAIKTRKLRLARFKDTKKVNFYLFVSVINGYSMLAYWQALYAINPLSPARAYVTMIGHLNQALLVQLLLIVPKVWPPLVEKVTGLLKSNIRSKAQP